MNPTEMDCVKTIAVFDFDGTLAAHDSLWPFLVAVAGFPRCVLAVLGAAAAYLVAKDGDHRTIVKEKLLFTILRGRRAVDLKTAIKRMKEWPCWLDSLDALKKHHEQGHHILIASGSLDLYIEEMLAGIPHDGVLCTRMEVVDGVLTGRMESGNCVRQRKAELVRAYMQQNGPFGESWAYGNAPHDLPMMELMTHCVII